MQRTNRAGTSPFGLCQRFDLLSIGALRGLERTYAAGANTAGELVAEFPDAQNAVRASKVLEAWQRQCRGRVQGRNVRVRPINQVSVPRGSGWFYLVSYERQVPGQASGRPVGHFHSLGLLLAGTRMVLIRMDHDGQDHDYAPGRDPMELAVKAVAAKLG